MSIACKLGLHKKAYWQNTPQVNIMPDKIIINRFFTRTPFCVKCFKAYPPEAVRNLLWEALKENPLALQKLKESNQEKEIVL